MRSTVIIFQYPFSSLTGYPFSPPKRMKIANKVTKLDPTNATDSFILMNKYLINILYTNVKKKKKSIVLKFVHS